MKPLFMWAGGKNKMLKHYKPHLPETFEKYVEPFFGGGAMFIWAYAKQPNAEFVINDVNDHIINIYKSIKSSPDLFCKKLDELSAEYLPLLKKQTNKKWEKKMEKDWAKLYELNPNRRYFFFKLRNEYAFDWQKWSKVEEGAVLYFLMKTAFNGVWQVNKNTGGRFGTPCGLLNQKDKVYDKKNVMLWHQALQNCTIMSGDFSDTLKHVEANTYVFLDPPYRGSFTQYETDFDDKLQEGVIKYLNDSVSQGAYALLSNRDVGDNFFEQRMGSNDLTYFDVTYTVGRRKKNEEGNFEAKKAKEILMIGGNKP